MEHGVGQQRVFSVGNPVDWRLFARRTGGVAPWHESGTTTALFIGRLVPSKGLRELLEAFHKIRSSDVRLVVIGAGPLQGLVEAAIRKDRRVLHVPHVEYHELPAHYQSADFVVLPSMYEPWGLVLNEAMSAGLPVIATTECGASDELVLDGHNGRVIRAGSHAELLSALGAMFRDSSMRRRLARNAEATAPNWGVERALPGFAAALECALADS